MSKTLDEIFKTYRLDDKLQHQFYYNLQADIKALVKEAIHSSYHQQTAEHDGYLGLEELLGKIDAL